MVLIAAFLIVGFFLPKSAYSEHTTNINAPADVVFTQVNNLHNWEAWSPFKDEDSNMTITYGEIAEGVGGSYSWTGNMGEGTLTIKESEADSLIKTEVVFDEDGKQIGYGTWTFVSNEDGTTEASWRFGMEDLAWPLGRYYGLFMDAGMQPFLIKGLENIKTIAESAPSAVGKTGDIVLTDIPEQYIVAIRDSITVEEMGPFYEKSYGAIMAYLMANGKEAVGYPMSITLTWNENGKSLIEAAMPVAKVLEITENEEGIYSRLMIGSKAVMASHWGPYETVGSTYMALEKYMKDNGLMPGGAPYEVYITDPSTEPDVSKWETQIIWPVLIPTEIE